LAIRLKITSDYATFEQMMRTVAIALILLLLAFAAPASEIKALVGMNWNRYLFADESDSLNHRQKSGFGIGPGWAFHLKPRMKLEVDALFSNKGAKATLAYTPDKKISGYYTNSSIGFPVLFRYQLKETASPYAALGPEFVYIMSHQLKIPQSGDRFDLLEYTQRFLLAFHALLGYQWPVDKWGLFAEIRYSRWLGNSFSASECKVKCESVSLYVGVFHDWKNH
jgi:hypothetical protein